MVLYSFLLGIVLVLGAPYWLVRMMTSGRYRAGLAGRLGRIPADVLEAGEAASRDGRRLVWVHAVSVGEVLAATALVAAMREAGLVVAVSTTTQAGQALAKRRFVGCAVFYMPLDFGVLVRRYMRALRPKLVVTMESELWPNVIRECKRARVPLAVVNARVSDRSFPRYLRLKGVWGPLLREVSLFLAQSTETAERLRAIGVAAERVRVSGNLKFDVRAPKKSEVAERILELAQGRPVVVAGSTVAAVRNDQFDEEMLVIQAWEKGARQDLKALLVLAPRHTDRFTRIEALIVEFQYLRASDWKNTLKPDSTEKNVASRASNFLPGREGVLDVILLDTIGDLAAVYGVANVAFVGGSVVAKGGHNPLEPAQFGVPVVMGRSYENFKQIVGAMREADAIRIVGQESLATTLVELMTDTAAAKAMGERGRAVFQAQAGATGRTMEALLELMAVGR
jgi:3-deoxy-D-manno-octulosonic-acid transferase